ncbi:hypothetical protein ASD53_18665 [Lysobacter sp. Root559]|uniref:DUF2846 domain-containing protein n=1 Tax=Lysobacter sp. Root559 TaxID=1736559 RepID=UPI0006F379EB|nr:DUF2846 domain-containing protein [Lysobacter sp. Root559]KQZ63561.1 hypothetical protein ASD53_18665 [Lysobacter sp. Root559]
MNLKFRVSALALGLMFSGAVLAQDVAQPAATAAAEASDDATAQAAGTIGVPPQGKGQIVFFRPSKFVGAAVGFKVREGETELGKLRSGKYFVHVADPGTHEYRVHGETKDVLTMEIEAGETYYVQGTLGMGIVAGRPNLSPTDAAAFNALADKLKLAK